MSECNHDCEHCASSQGCGDKIEKAKLNNKSSIKHVVGVLSGKGGVGKSYVTSLLAVSLAKQGFKVGILDADITGPSIPKAFGINEQAYGEENLIYPAKSKKYEINQMLIDYISNRSNLFCVFQICDIQHITEMDIDVFKNVSKRFVNVYIVLNKVDKVNNSYFNNNKHKIAKMFGCKEQNLIPVSAFKKLNISYIKRLMNILTKKLK
mgnify:CR=1 FL=1